MSSIQNQGFIIYIKFFLSLTLHYSVGFGQILIHILMKKLGIRKSVLSSSSTADTAQKMKFSIKDLFSKCDQIRRKLRIWSHLLKKSLMENFILCAV